MKRYLIITGLLLFTLISMAQDAKEILIKSYGKKLFRKSGYGVGDDTLDGIIKQNL